MRKNFTRNKLAERINVKLGYSKEEAKEFIEIFLNYIKININTKKILKYLNSHLLRLLVKKKELVVILKQGKMQLSQKEK